MAKLDPRTPGFTNIKNLINKINADRKSELESVVSASDRDVPAWQRQVVWTEDEMGLLIYSIIRSYPIGLIILWKKPNSLRVPIDGRQRISAIKEFYDGKIAIPDLPIVEDAYKKEKIKLLDGDIEKGFTKLATSDIDAFEDYPLQCLEYTGIDEKTAMSIFVMLQGGKSLTKTEVRAALGGKLCDFVTELTSKDLESDDDTDDEIPTLPKNHFFKALSLNLANRRKSHRNVADVLIHEYFYPDTDKHWSSLQTMYQEKSTTFHEKDKKEFKLLLSQFNRDLTIKKNNKGILIPQLRTAYFILTVFKAFKAIKEGYTMPKNFKFVDCIREFETVRVSKPKDGNFLRFTSALSNAGYAFNRIQERHDILMSFILQKYPTAKPKIKSRKRLFTIEQKIAIWERANGKCETKGCNEEFDNPRKADADHIVMWKDGGETTVANGRLLCQKHNRGRKS